MDKKEFFAKAEQWSVNKKRLEKIHEQYGQNLPLLIEKIISNCNESIFFENGIRILSYAEILDAERDLHVEFNKQGIIPIADCSDNDFIVYEYIRGFWTKFNIVDETMFKKRNSLEELL